MSSLAVPVLTCVHDSASLQFARILARVAVKKRLHQVSASRRDDARGRGRRKRKRPPGGGRSCTGCGEEYSPAASAAALAPGRAVALPARSSLRRAFLQSTPRPEESRGG